MVELRELLPWPAADANKYSRGKLLVVGGSTRYPGAAILAAKAAARSGAGYVTLAVPEDIAQVAQSHLLTVPVMACDSEDGVFSEDAALQLLAACGRCDAVLMGPGLTREAASLGGLLELFVLGCEAPLLLDADALALAATPEMAALLRERAAGGWTTVMTPHDGEAKRLYEALNSPQGWGVERYPSECPPPREGLSKALAAAYGATVVAKGPVTYVATSGGATWDFRDGSPALATAGTGDVLAGIIAALMAQGLSAYDASRLGVTMHGLAGVDAARELTSICVTAADVIEHIPAAVRGIAGKEN